MSNIITADYNGTQVFFQDDAYLNATAIAKHFNKSPRRWLELPTTIEYIDLLSKKLNVGKSDILKTTRGVNGGTWLHRRLAVPFARWLNVEFAIWCDEQIEKILIGQNQAPTFSNNTFSNNTFSNNTFSNNTITPEQQAIIQAAVSKAVYRTGLHWRVIYSQLNSVLSIPRYTEMKQHQLQNALIFINCIQKPAEIEAKANNATISLTDDEVIELCWGIFSAKQQNDLLRELLTPLNVIRSSYFSQVYDYSNEYRSCWKHSFKILDKLIPLVKGSSDNINYHRIVKHFQDIKTAIEQMPAIFHR